MKVLSKQWKASPDSHWLLMRVCRACIKEEKKARRSLEEQYHSWVESSRGGDLYSSFCWSFFWKHTGRMETTAKTPKTMREFQDTASPAVVSLYSVVPAFIATNDGGATPVHQTTDITGFGRTLCKFQLTLCWSSVILDWIFVLLYRNVKKISDICGTGYIFIFLIITLVIFA